MWNLRIPADSPGGSAILLSIGSLSSQWDQVQVPAPAFPRMRSITLRSGGRPPQFAFTQSKFRLGLFSTLQLEQYPPLHAVENGRGIPVAAHQCRSFMGFPTRSL